MRQLPAIEVVKQSYRFLSSELATVIRLAWFPLLIVSAVQYFVERQSLEGMIVAMQSGDVFAALSQPRWPALVATLLALLGGAIVAVAIHRVILFGDRKEGTFIYFAFGKVEALFALLPIIVGVIAVILFGSAFVAGFTPDEGPNLVVLGVAVAAALILVFLSVRFAMLWPIVVVEERYDFGQAWEMSRNNFWRLFGAFILAVLPFIVVMLVASIALQGGMATIRTPDEIVPALEHILGLLPIQVAVTYVITILLTGMSVAVLSYAYKALKGYGPDDIVT